MIKKKGYHRNPYSFERVLKDLADDIGYSNIETVIEKKRKAIEHISNPNFKDRQLHIQDGLELDIHCKKIGKGTPFLTAYETLLRKEITAQNNHGTSDEIIDNLLRLGESIGDVMEETRKALDDDKVDDIEKENISIEVIKLENKIAELKLKLNLGDKTDYKSQKKREL
ncbi:hypothetical protein N9570_04020 [Candidatus Pelagibacter sp.]|nr:hypothetical protein [Candidatus Pelagibacter sp.]